MAPADTYICTQCGSDNTGVVRKDPTNPRVKCNSCHFMFNGQDSVAAGAAGAIQPSSAEALAGATEPDVERLMPPEHRQAFTAVEAQKGKWDIPTKPAYVFIAKDKSEWEFVTKRDFNKAAMRWAQRSQYDVYELTQMKLKVDISFHKKV